MTVVVPVAADVKKLTSGVSTQNGTMEASTACVQADLVVLNSAGTYVLAVNTTVDAADISSSGGLALAAADAGKNVDFVNAIGTEIDLGASLTEGTWYVVSSTAGKIEPFADLTTGDAIQFVGYGNTNNNLTYYPIKTSETKS